MAYAEAWVSEPAPDILYDWAQVERLSGHCEQAVPLYDRFLAMDDEGRPPPRYATLFFPEDWARMVERATQMRDQCRAELEATATAEPTSPPPEEPTPTGPATVPAAISEPAPAVDEATPGRPRRKDPAGIALVAVGSALVGAGTGLVITAAVHDAGALELPTHDDYLRRIDTAAAEQLAGFVALGVGSAAVLGGAIRLALVATGRRPRTRATAWAGRHGAGLGVAGRF